MSTWMWLVFFLHFFGKTRCPHAQFFELLKKNKNCQAFLIIFWGKWKKITMRQPIIHGTLLTFLPKKVFFPSKCAWISSTILTFLPNNPVCFYTKNSQKVIFSSNCGYNTGHFIDFSPKKSDFFLKMRLHIEHYFDFFAQ